MKIYAYRCVDNNNEPEGCHGIIFLSSNSSQKELFWAVDEFVDPGSCQYARISEGEVIGLNLAFEYGQFNNRKAGDGRKGYELSEDAETSESGMVTNLQHSEQLSDVFMSNLRWGRLIFDMEEMYG